MQKAEDNLKILPLRNKKILFNNNNNNNNQQSHLRTPRAENMTAKITSSVRPLEDKTDF